MIHFFFIQNKVGRVRLAKWYDAYTESEKVKLTSDIHRLLVTRGSRHTNFLEFHNIKLVYRRYVGLYFICGVDESENELSCLEAIHMFVEILDSYFGSVCELDLIYYFHKVYQVIDEVFLAGEVMEHRKQVILSQLRAIDQLASQSQ